MIPDLHMHSTASDGVLTPAQLVDFAASRGVTVMALTDHDTFDGVDSLRAVQTSIPVLPGIELSMADMHGLHLLGYGWTEAPALRQTVRTLANSRLSRARRMVEKLTELGYPLDYEALCAACQGSVGRPHIARAMVAAGYVKSTEDAFARLIGDDGPAYVPNERLTMAQALPLLRRNGFIPVMAHPAEVTQHHLTLRTLLNTWKEQGLMGLEVYHPANQKMGFSTLDSMARSMGLLVTGGSDYHCDDDHHGQPGCTVRHWPNAAQDVDALRLAMAEKPDF